MVNCNECIHISITEEKQNELKKYKGREAKWIPNHKCNKYNKRILHKGYHTMIIPCCECGGSNFENKK